MTIHSADENWTMGTYNPATHKVVPMESVVIEEVLSCMPYQVNSDGTKFKYKIEGFAVDWEPFPKVT